MKASQASVVDIVEFVDKFKQMKKPSRRNSRMRVENLLCPSPNTVSTRESSKFRPSESPNEQRILPAKREEAKQALPLKTIRKLLNSQMMNYELPLRARRNSSLIDRVRA